MQNAVSSAFDSKTSLKSCHDFRCCEGKEHEIEKGSEQEHSFNLVIPLVGRDCTHLGNNDERERIRGRWEVKGSEADRLFPFLHLNGKVKKIVW